MRAFFPALFLVLVLQTAQPLSAAPPTAGTDGRGDAGASLVTRAGIADAHLALVLRSRNEAGMAAAARAVADPRGANFRRYLTRDQVAARFGPDPEQVAKLRLWLARKGLRSSWWPGGTVLDVWGPDAMAAAAFGAAPWRSSAANSLAQSQSAALAGISVTEVGVQPSVPRQFAALVAAVIGTRSADSSIVRSSTPSAVLTGRGPGGGYTPREIAGAYNFTQLYSGGYHGEHTRVALVEFASYDPHDLALYASWAGVKPSIHLTQVGAGNADRPANVEATLDLELMSAIAPAAAIDVYNAQNDSTGVGLLDAYSAVVSAGNAQVLGLTWDTCEAVASRIPGLVEGEHTLFRQLALQGTTIVSATGDAGAYACSDPKPPAGSAPGLADQLTVNLPASDPYALAVGATDLTVRITAGDAAIGFESAWSCTARTTSECPASGKHGHGSGGGLSSLFRAHDGFGDDLTWQTGPGVLNAFTNGARQLPDVSASGSFGVSKEHEYAIYWQRGWSVAGGTSAAAIVWAALIALTDQYLEQKGFQDAGWINPVIYQLGAAVQPYLPYHDIVVGNNLLYAATTGWDYASGWGTPDAWNFVRDIAAFGIRLDGSTATPTPSIVGLPSASPTSMPTPTATNTPVPAKRCPATGIGNGSFGTGTLACWHAGGRPAPRMANSPVRGEPPVALIGGGQGQRVASQLSQVASEPRASKMVLSIRYAVRITRQPCGAACAGQLAAMPTVQIFTASGQTYIRTLVGGNTTTWNTLNQILPLCGPHAVCAAGRWTVALTVPPQHGAVRVILYIRSLRLQMG